MTDLATLVEPLKREVAVPGTFDDVFPDTDDAALTAQLLDAFSEAQLLGFFPDLSLSGTQTMGGDPAGPQDISAAAGALVVLVAGMRMIRAQMRALNSQERYKAGAVEFDVSRSINLLRDELKYLQTRMDDLIQRARRSGRGAQVYVMDAYPGRVAFDFVGQFYSWEVGVGLGGFGLIGTYDELGTWN